MKSLEILKKQILINEEYHIPVLLQESVDGLQIRDNGVYVDATFGAGSHSTSILNKLNAKGHLYSFDQDADAAKNSFDDARFTFVYGNFRYLKRYLKYEGIDSVDGILADLGVSSHQFDTGDRGFSYRFEGALDMRMNGMIQTTAADVLNTYHGDELVRIFSRYGNVRNAKTLSRSIVKKRKTMMFSDIQSFVEHLEKHKMGSFQKYVTTVFQALRIEVNDELNALCDFLDNCRELLKPGGRLSVISYHSMEDKIVKNLIKTGYADGVSEVDEMGREEKYFIQVNKKLILPTEEEVERNSRAKSAKLRIAERI